MPFFFAPKLRQYLLSGKNISNYNKFLLHIKSRRVIITADEEEDNMTNRPIKKMKILAAATALCVASFFTGCAALPMFGEKAPELPANAQSFEKHDADSVNLMMIEVNGRTYAPFGTLNGKLSNDSLRDCLGYIDNDKNDRLYSLYEDPYDNYLVTKNVNGVMEQPMFWRDFSTYGESIFTPEYIVSKDDVYWGKSGCYSEMKEFRIMINIDADDVKEVSMEYKGNGRDLGSAGVMNAIGGLKNPDGKLALKRGENLALSITEVSLNGKLDIDKPFDAECVFFVESVDGKKHEIDYVYKGNVKLGDEVKVTLTGNAKDGYKIS